MAVDSARHVSRWPSLFAALRGEVGADYKNVPQSEARTSTDLQRSDDHSPSRAECCEGQAGPTKPAVLVIWGMDLRNYNSVVRLLYR